MEQVVADRPCREAVEAAQLQPHVLRQHVVRAGSQGRDVRNERQLRTRQLYDCIRKRLYGYCSTVEL
jgi:hypothetical protein